MVLRALSHISPAPTAATRMTATIQIAEQVRPCRGIIAIRPPARECSALVLLVSSLIFPAPTGTMFPEAAKVRSVNLPIEQARPRRRGMISSSGRAINLPTF